VEIIFGLLLRVVVDGFCNTISYNILSCSLEWLFCFLLRIWQIAQIFIRNHLKNSCDLWEILNVKVYITLCLIFNKAKANKFATRRERLASSNQLVDSIFAP